MINSGGFVKIYRKMTEWEWFNDPIVMAVWMHCLLRASYKKRNYKGMVLEPGMFVFGRKEFAEEIGISERQIRTALDKLQKSKNLTIKATNKGSVATVEKWEKYQEKPKRATNTPTSKRPANDQQTTTNKNSKNNNTTYYYERREEGGGGAASPVPPIEILFPDYKEG